MDFWTKGRKHKVTNAPSRAAAAKYFKERYGEELEDDTGGAGEPVEAIFSRRAREAQAVRDTPRTASSGGETDFERRAREVEAAKKPK